ncbi:MAG TPA: type VI secretion system contractile sheath small subunit [Candidatus Sumerlaeota bacterium]|nr:type VI secretion system contractile sheath small subunit [Candidatus Sumerlaeota bacterium]HPK03228.1 type VI secretion system contractile sheath small subunit [Candidatus Sumerlaeota bacterium]
MAKEGSVAPQERVNIVYKPATGGAQEEKELPLKLLMLGDYTLREDDRALEDRDPIKIDKDNFDEVMRNQNLSLNLEVDNRLVDDSDEQLAVKLKISSMKDFEPESIARQMPETNKLLQLRQALNALKAPLANKREFRKKIEAILADETARQKLLDELGIGDE